MRNVALIIGVSAVLAAPLTGQAQSRPAPVVLDIEQGETAFALDPAARKAWWIKGECKVALDIDRDGSSDTILLSRPKTETLSLGDRQIRLRQQFRFEIDGELANAYVYSSVRGGWAAVSVTRDTACTNSACRALPGLSEC